MCFLFLSRWEFSYFSLSDILSPLLKWQNATMGQFPRGRNEKSVSLIFSKYYLPYLYVEVMNKPGKLGRRLIKLTCINPGTWEPTCLKKGRVAKWAHQPLHPREERLPYHMREFALWLCNYLDPSKRQNRKRRKSLLPNWRGSLGLWDSRTKGGLLNGAKILRAKWV